MTRARVLRYWERHGPCPVRQVCRALKVDRRYVQKVLRQKGDVLIEGMGMKISDIVRFWSKVDKTPGHGPHGDCWVWTAAISPEGYPHGFGIEGKHYQASHIALKLDGRPRPDGLLALHSCDNRVCVNPVHLRWGTDEENAEDHRQRGQRGPRWSPDDVVREILASPERNKDIAERLGMSPATICNIRKGRAHRKIFEEYCRPDAA